jgi:hypothetical protein
MILKGQFRMSNKKDYNGFGELSKKPIQDILEEDLDEISAYAATTLACTSFCATSSCTLATTICAT